MKDPLASTSESESAYADAVTESENTVCPAHQCGIPCPDCGHVRVCDCFAEPESVRNNKAEKIAWACINAKHKTLWNPWQKYMEPELCDKCDEKIGVMFH